MSAKFFGQFLISRGRISGEDLVRAIRYQQKHNLGLGERAQKAGLIDQRQLHWLSMETKRGTGTFETLVQKRGWLSTAQLGRLLEEQRREHLRVGEVLVIQQALTQAQLDEELAAFKADEPSPPAAPEDGTAASAWLSSLAQCTVTQLGRVAGVAAKLAPSEGEGRTDGAYVETRLGLSGDVAGWFELRMPRELALFVAGGLLGEGLESDDAVADAVGEFANIVAGNFCGLQADAGRSVTAAVPKFSLTPPPGQAARGHERRACRLFTTSGDMMVVLETAS